MLRIEIPQYLRDMTLSQSQRAQYVEWNGVFLKSGKTKPPLYITGKEHREKTKQYSHYNLEWLHEDYRIGVFKDTKLVLATRFDVFKQYPYPTYKHLIIDKGCIPITMNTEKIGKPRLRKINGQDLYSGTISPHTRGSMMQQIKESFLPFVTNLPVIEEDYPFRVDTDIFDVIGAGNWDIGNRALPYNKAMLDLLRSGKTGVKDSEGKSIVYFKPKIKEDSILFITQEGGARFAPIDNEEERRIVFTFVKDERPAVLRAYEQYKNNKTQTKAKKPKQPAKTTKARSMVMVKFDFLDGI